MHWKRITHSRDDHPFYGTASRFAREQISGERPQHKYGQKEKINSKIKRNKFKWLRMALALWAKMKMRR